MHCMIRGHEELLALLQHRPLTLELLRRAPDGGEAAERSLHVTSKGRFFWHGLVQ
jgi:hypothetical protein